MRPAAGKPPKKKRIDGAESELALFGCRACTLHVVKHPGDLGGGKVWIKQQSGLACYFLFVAGPLQRLAMLGGAPILPYDRIVDGVAGLAIPNHRSLSLIGNANPRDVPGGDVCL